MICRHLLHVSLAAAALFSTVAQGFNDQKCFDFRAKYGWWRKYDYKYFGNSTVTWKACQQDGLSKFSSQKWSQTSTITSDPGVTTTGDTVGGIQCMSSWGACSFIGASEKIEERESFIAANLPEIKQEMALGRGDYLATLTYLSACKDGSADMFAAEMQKNYGYLRQFDSTNNAFSGALDSVIRSNPQLASTCLAL